MLSLSQPHVVLWRSGEGIRPSLSPSPHTREHPKNAEGEGDEVEVS